MTKKHEIQDKKADAKAAKPAGAREAVSAFDLAPALPEVSGATLQRMRKEPGTLSPQQALMLQRTVGNGAVTRLLEKQRPPAGAGRGARNGVGRADIQRDETLLGGTATPEATKTASDTFDSVTKTTSKSETSGFVGKQAVKKTESLKEGLEKTSPKQIEDTIEYMARVGAFGEAAKEAALERGGLSVKGNVKAEGGIGAKTDLKAGLEVSYDAFEMMKAFVDASAQVGLSGSVQAGAQVALGEKVALELKGKIDALAGAMVMVSGKASIGMFHVALSGAAEAFAGAKVSGEASATLTIGDAAATATVQGEAMAGVSAKAKGEFSIGLSGVSIGGSAEAFAGLKASGSGATKLTLKGVTIISAKGTVEVSAGVGGKAKGEFKFEMGKLKIGGGLGAALGLGIGADVEVEIDFVALGDAIQKMIIAAFYKKSEEVNRKSPEAERVPLIDEDLIMKYRKLGYETVYNDLEAYAQRLAKSRGPVQRENIQLILDNRYSKLKEAYLFQETDDGVMLAINSALFKSGLEEISVQAGQIRTFKAAGSGKDVSNVKNLFG